MRIFIDRDRCMGHGRCYTVAEAILSDDDEGFVAERGQCLEVPEDRAAEARQAAGACPERAISLLDAPAGG